MATNQGVDPQTMREVIAAARTKFKQGFKETARIRSYRLQKEILSKAVEESAEHGWEWSLRIKAAQGSTQMLDPFEQINYVRDEYDVSLKVTPRTATTHKNMWFDRLVKLINQGAENKIWSDYKMKASAAEESRAEMWESKLLNPPYTVSDKDGFLGLLYIFRRSMTSGGVFTEQLTPARNGVYYRNGAGSVASDMYNVSNVALAVYARLRTLVATHRGVWSKTLQDTLDDCIRDAGFEYLEDLEGDKSTMNLVIFWDDDFDRDYDKACTALGGPRRRDLYEVGEVTARGVRTVAVPSFNNHFLRPIFGVNLAELKFRKERAGWEVQGEQLIGHNGMAFPVDSTGQMWAENPQSAGFLIHGSHASDV